MFCFVFMLFIAVCCARNSLPDKTDDGFQNEILNAHNEVRRRHHVPDLVRDQGAINYAKQRCQLISQSDGLSHGHAGLQGYGENLYWGGSSNPSVASGKSALDSWYNEIKQYDFNRPGFSGATGHFTQVVWKGTRGVGCARAAGKGGSWYETYVCCNYTPVGNVVGGDNFKNNVLRA